MKFVTFVAEGGTAPRPGLVRNDVVVDLGMVGINDIKSLIEQFETISSQIEKAVGEGKEYPLHKVRLLAPIRPPRVFGIGLNYADHAAESKMKVQAVPTVFLKLSSSVIGTDDAVILPKASTQPDYEAELGVVIGKAGYQIAASDWEQYVFGYIAVNDVSARDVQMATSQWSLGKSFPTFTPIGPCIVTRDEVSDPHALDIALTIDGETLQSSNTRNLIFRIPQLIEHISSITPLEAGDVISTGTPEGVGLGRNPQRWLKPGEEIVVTIQSIGQLRNRTRAEA